MAKTIDVIDVLTEDHQVMRDLIQQFEASEQPSEMRRLYLRIVDEVSTHEAAEESVVYPAFRAAVPAGTAEALARSGEHEEVDELIEGMRRLPPSGLGFAKRACALVLGLAAHLDAEEEVMFPLLRANVAPERLIQLADEVLAVKDRAPAFHGAPR